jgi:hypothetical protein
MLVKRYRAESRSGDMIEYSTYYDMRLIVPGAVFVWQNAVQ